ncbi:MAG: glycosyl transferase [Armatimonadota bacterium]|nr:MAG: glycosyl transferase [Armatimonadota bacterium]
MSIGESNGNARRVLIVRLSSIGDTILTTPLLAAIRDSSPQTEVDWVVGQKSRQIVEMCEGVSRIFTFPKVYGPRMAIQDPAGALEFSRTLRQLKAEMGERCYDLALDVQGLLKSALATAISGARLKMGWSRPWAREFSWLFTDVHLPMRNDCHVVESWLDLTRAAGFREKQVRFPLRVPEDALTEARTFLESIRGDGPVVVMNMGASKREKCWQAASFARLAEMVRRDTGGVSVFCWGSDWEKEMAEEAARLSGGAGVVSFRTTLFTLGALVQLCDAYVGADTGPTHLAAALGRPVVALFGVTNPRRVAPFGREDGVISRYDGPIDGVKVAAEDTSAMASITPEEVYQRLRPLLGQERNR